MTKAPRIPRSAEDRNEHPSMVQVDGVWVHQGVAHAAVDWDRVIDDARDERIAELLQGTLARANGEPDS